MKTLQQTSSRQYKLKFYGNQHIKVIVRERKAIWRAFAVIVCLTMVIIGKIIISTNWNNEIAVGKGEYLSPIASQVFAAQVSPTAQPTPSISPQDSIREEIQQVFGIDSPKAFKLLECENSALNPSAVNMS